MEGFLGKEVVAGVKETRARTPEWFDLAELVNNYCHKILLTIKPDNNNSQVLCLI